MKFLIAGFGSIGRRHFYNLKALGQNDVLFYRSSKSQPPDEELQGYLVESDIQAALAHLPDAVIVANPTALHLDVAIPTAESGSHVLLEKPISNSTDHLDELKQAVNKSGCRLLVGFQFRFHPGLRKAREILASGELGKPISAQAHWGEYLPDWHPWEDYRQSYSARRDLGGGVVLTLSHPLDYLRWLLGDVVSVTGKIQRSGKLEIEVEDEANLDLDFVNGARASVHLDYLQKPAAHWLEIVCAGGKMHWDAATGSLRIFFADGHQKEFPAPVGFERNDLFLSEMRHFINVVNGEGNPVCTLDDGIKALQIALAAHRSSEKKQKIDL